MHARLGGAVGSMMPCVAVIMCLGTLEWSSATSVRAAEPVPRASLVREEAKLKAAYRGGRTIEVEMLWVRPPGNGPFPLAVITHGSPRGTAGEATEARRRMRPDAYIGIAEEMARRGWAVATLMRRGYGRSGGAFAESYGPCEAADFEKGGNATADDLEAAIKSLSRSSFIDAGHILALGQSAGGFGVLALAGRAIPGLKGVVNFSGGRGSTRPNANCSEERLVAAFGAFGKRAKVPSVWIYAEGDGFFRSELVRRFHQRFTSAGGRAELHILTGVAGDGHQVFRRRYVPLWREPLGAFLKANQLATWERGPPDHCPERKPPAQLNQRAQRLWGEFMCAENHKAFAISETDGRVGYASFRRTVEIAKDEAMRLCVGDRAERRCRVAAIDDE